MRPPPAKTLARHATVACAIQFAVLTTTGCSNDQVPVIPAVAARDVRVRLFDGSAPFRLRITGPYELRDSLGNPTASAAAMPWTDVRVDSGLRIGDRGPFHAPITIVPKSYGAIQIADLNQGVAGPTRHYAGSLILALTGDGGVRAVNLVDVESYLAGVLPNEVWPSFRNQTLEAQAIAARTFILFLMSRNASRDCDVTAGEGDQVYRGIDTSKIGRRVRFAVNQTHGLVLAYDDGNGPRIFCAYYSAACGGVTQGAQAIGIGPVPPPLQGGVQCDFCSIAPDQNYRWGPAEIPKDKFLDRLKSRVQRTESWDRITNVEVTQTSDGRIQQLLIRGPADDTITMSGESFRLTVGGRTMLSTACKLIDEPKLLRFENGKGFGHGVGLCQWGAEGQARLNRTAAEILHFYYPGSTIVRAY